MNKKYIVTLTTEERTQLQTLISTGRAAARTLTHARILLKAERRPDAAEATDAEISQALTVSLATIARVRERCVEAGLEVALHRHSSDRPRARKLDGTQEAHLIALHCGPPPKGQARWILRLLADRLVELEIVDSIAPETVRLTLKKRTQALVEATMVYSARGPMPTSSGKWKMCWRSTHRPLDPQQPLVCMDEASKQLVGEVRAPLPRTRAGRALRLANMNAMGSAICSCSSQPLLGWREVRVTDQRTAQRLGRMPSKSWWMTHFPSAEADHVGDGQSEHAYSGLTI